MEAQEHKLGRSVAMKVMLHRHTSEANKQRFLQEARVLGQLAHPNIVPIHDLGTDGWGRLFYTMKLVQGDTLHEVLDRLREGDAATIAKYPLNHLLTVFQKVCDAMSFAHARGVLHRDLKPQNIMVGEFGEVLVMDWGLAKILPGSPAAQPLAEPEPGGWSVVGGGADLEKTLFTEPSSLPAAVADSLTFSPAAQPMVDDLGELPLSPTSTQLTIEGAVMGTPQFMSPEQANGELAKLDERSDIYALGAILYTVLTLRPPMEGDDLRQLIALARNPKIIAPVTVAETQRKMLTEASEANQPPPLSAVALCHCPAGEVPAALSAVAMKALRREQAARYQSVAELIQDLVAYQQGFATSAEEADALTLVRLFVHRHRALAAAAVLVLLVVVIALPLVIAAERKATRNALLAGVKEQEASQSAASAQANELKAEAHAKQAQAAEARAEQEKELARRALAEAKTALAETHIRDSDVAAARRVLGQVPENLRDSNWTYLLARTDTSLATLRSFNTEHILRVAANPAKPGAFAMLGADHYLSMVDARTGRRDGAVLLSKLAASGNYLLAVSPKGEEIAVANEATDQITFYREGRAQPLRTWKTQRPLSVEFHPTERTVLVVSLPLPGNAGTNELWLHNADTGEVKWKFDTGSTWNHAVFHPSGKFVIVTYGDNHACLVNATTGQRFRDLPSTASAAQHLTASPDGTMYAVGDYIGTVRVFNLVDNNLQLAFRASEGRVEQVLFTKESRRIVTLGANPISRVNEVRVWSVASGYPIQNLLGGDAQPFRAALHPTSGELIVAGPVAKAWELNWLQPTWILSGEVEDARAGFLGKEDAFILRDRGQAALVRLHDDGTASTFWRAPTGRNLIDLNGKGQAALLRLPAAGTTNALARALANRNLIELSGLAQAALSRVTTGAGEFGLVQLESAQPEETATWNPVFAMSGPVRLDPTGERVWTGRQVLDARTGAELQRFPDTFPTDLWAGEWLDANRLLIAYTLAGKEMLAVVNVTNGALTCTTLIGERRFPLCVAPNGQLIAEASLTKIVRLRDTTTLAVQREFRAHDGTITAMRFHPVEPLLATGSEDYTIRLWRSDTGAQARDLRGALVSPRHLAFSPSGRRLAGMGTDRQVRIWDVEGTNTLAPPPRRLLLPDWQDLLAETKPQPREAKNPTWQFKAGQLNSPNRKYSTIPVAGGFAHTDYHLQVTLRRRAPQDSVHIFLPVAGRQTSFVIDGYPRSGFVSALHYLDGDGGLKQPGAVRGLQIKDTASHQLDLLVRAGPRVSSIEVRLDNRPLLHWSGLTSALSMNGNFTGLAADEIGLGAHTDEWTIEAMQVKSLEAKP